MDQKKHFKLFKAGKKWCTMAITTVAVTVGLTAMVGNASADEVVNTTDTTPLVTETSDNNQQQVTDNSDNGQETQSATNVDNQEQPERNIDYQTPVNAGYLDEATTTDQGDVEFSGWHATNQYQDGMHHFVIVVDGNGHELYRNEVTTVNRPDVEKLYPTTPISGDGGFKIDVPTDKLASVTSIKLVSRYTEDENGNIDGGTDYWFPEITTKAGWLDRFRVACR